MSFIRTKEIPPAQAASKVVPFKDWTDIIIPEGEPNLDYKVSLYRRKTAIRRYRVLEATLTPLVKKD